MKRLYTETIQHHFSKNRQMVFLAGPRQVGKTTCSKMVAEHYRLAHYINGDVPDQRKLLIKGAEVIANHYGLQHAAKDHPLFIFDEIHKYRKWKLFLKGFFDLYEDQASVIVTGSSKLDVYRRGGDSLMGRYFLYRMHPLTISELLNTSLRTKEIISPRNVSEKLVEKLLTFGGFPESYQRADRHFYNNWQRTRREQLLKEDIRALSQIQNFSELEYLLDIVIESAGTQLNVATIGNQLNIAQSTIHRWINLFQAFYFCYTIKPWHQNVRRAIRKMPKIYLWDWSLIRDQGRLYENFIASHLLKAVHYWTDVGFGQYDLYYLRDKEKREVDFLVTKDRKPWFLVEVKSSANAPLSDALGYFQSLLKTSHAFQLAMEAPWADIDCFRYHRPTIVPASTFLSQLV
jgi:predicted AAA+ superfamily ATPase